uniref:Uncharacterized protein n=1 Tax=Rhizophora mucronata TaxID=61149 RepID=A0A2P2M9K7_RHIMU
MELVKSANGGRFHSAIYHRLLLKIVSSMEPIDFLLELLVSKYFKYIDIRYFTYVSLEKLATTLQVKDISDNKTTRADKDHDTDSRVSMELSTQKMHSLLSNVPPPEHLKGDSFNEMWSGSGNYLLVLVFTFFIRSCDKVFFSLSNPFCTYIFC